MKFWEKVYKTNYCWNWKGHITDKGYGAYFTKNKRILAHRFSYKFKKGRIPKGQVIDHLCRNRACVNPDHLEAVTHRENILRGIGTGAKYAKRTHCDNGHEFNSKNSLIRSDGGRRCIICRDERVKINDGRKSRWSRMSQEQRNKSRDRLRGWQEKQRLKKAFHS